MPRIFFCILSLVCVSPALGDDAEELAKFDRRIKPSDREHWAYQPVKAVNVPGVQNNSWVRNPIDAFVLSKLEARGWKPSSGTEPGALLRRVYLDLVGLPPTLAEQEAFLRNPSPEAVDRIVDELLSRASYGERWGRHWLDLARYAESNGYERDGLKPSVWRYRDYVIGAFNSDKPFDRFILEQLAGDELPDADDRTVIATGFLRLGPWDDEPADPRADRFDQLDDMVSTTSQVFLGMTLSCARCHDHKFDPLTMHDYYRMVAVFDPLQRPQQGRTDLDVPAVSGMGREALKKRDQEIQRWLQQNRLAQFVGGGRVDIASIAIAGIKKKQPDPPPGYFYQETASRIPDTQLLYRGVATRPGPKVSPGMPSVLVPNQPTFLPPGKYSSQRRLTFARWIASPTNPLTARVIVNRVWQHHFGEGLVRTPSDFGYQSEKPPHLELLDYLADRFVKEGWSIKKLHRLIMSSNAYRMSSRWNPEYGKEDPENRLLWRMPYRRLEVEAIRDSVLAVSGKLNTQMGGPSVNLPIPPEALEGNSDPKTAWKASEEKLTYRRTVYATVKRSLVVPLLESLDLCDTVRTAARRNVTTVAPQALMLFNGEFVNQQSRFLADRLEKEAGPAPEKQIDLAYRLALCRNPTVKEKSTLLEFLKKNSRDGVISRSAREQMGRVLFNLNEFVYVD